MTDSNGEEFSDDFIDMMKSSMPDKIISNFIIIAEVVGDCSSELSIVTSPAITPWLAQGMLQAAEELILTGTVTQVLDDDDDDGDQE